MSDATLADTNTADYWLGRARVALAERRKALDAEDSRLAAVARLAGSLTAVSPGVALAAAKAFAEPLLGLDPAPVTPPTATPVPAANGVAHGPAAGPRWVHVRRALLAGGNKPMTYRAIADKVGLTPQQVINALKDAPGHFEVAYRGKPRPEEGDRMASFWRVIPETITKGEKV